MAERYNKLYTLPGNLYAAGSPVVICAGALLKDNQTGKVLCQLKFRNICDVNISALKVGVTGYDMSGEEVCRVEHQYLDLNVARNGVFGAKEAIPLPERSVRSYDVQVLACFFTDGSRYFAEEQLWESLPEQPLLGSRLYDRELIRQYQLDTTNKSEYLPMEYKDLWFCACGEVNTEEESACHCCKQELENLKYYLNTEILIEEKANRLMEEAKAAAERESSRANSAKIIKRVLMVIVPLLIVAAGVWFFMSRSQQKQADYEMAEVLFAAEKYTEAAQAYEALGDYLDSADKARLARNILAETGAYEKAQKFLENGRYDDAYNAFMAMAGYEDSLELADEALYRKAIALTEEGKCDEAQQLFRDIAHYKDAAALAECFVKRLVSEETSYNAQCEGPLTTTYTYDEAGNIATRTELFSAYEGMKDKVYEYSWGGDGSYSVSVDGVIYDYDAWGILTKQDGNELYSFDYGYYEDGGIYYVGCYNLEDGGFVSETVYDEEGNVIRKSLADGTTTTVTNEYDSAGRLVKIENFDAEGAFVDRTSYEYDEEGNLKRSTYMDLNNVTAVTNYSYEVKYVPAQAQ